MLGALPLFAPGSGELALGQGGAPSAAAPPPSAPAQRPHSPSGRRPPAAYGLSPDRISLEQLRSEILGDEAAGAVPQLDRMLSGLSTVGLAHGGGDAGGLPGGASQPAPSGSPDAEWEIAPNGAWLGSGWRIASYVLLLPAMDG